MTMNNSVPASKSTVIFAFATIYIIWGSTYLAILFAIESIPPFLMSAFRFLGAGLILYVWKTCRGEQQPDFSSFGKNAIYGTLMLVGGTVSVTWAEQYISSSIAAIIVTAVPFWFIVLDKRQWSFYFSNKIIITGLFLGSLVAYLSYLWLLKIRPAALVSTYVYVNPIVALLLGTLIARERITVLHLSALVIILTGVLFVNMRKIDTKPKKLALP